MFNERLRQARKLNNFTQGQVSAALMLHRSTYAYYETGRSAPDLSTLVKLSKLFRVSTDWLLGADNLTFASEQCEYKTSDSEEKIDEIKDETENEKQVLTQDEQELIKELRSLNDDSYKDCCDYIKQKYNING